MTVGRWFLFGAFYMLLVATCCRTSAKRDRSRRVAGWIGMLMPLMVVVSMGLLVVVLASPFESIGTLALVTGIWLIVIGVMEIITAFGIRSSSKKTESPAPAEETPAAEPVAPAETTN